MIKKYSNLWKNCISLQVQEQNNQMCFLSSLSWAQHADGPPTLSLERDLQFFRTLFLKDAL